MYNTIVTQYMYHTAAALGMVQWSNLGSLSLSVQFLQISSYRYDSPPADWHRMSITKLVW